MCGHPSRSHVIQEIMNKPNSLSLRSSSFGGVIISPPSPIYAWTLSGNSWLRSCLQGSTAESSNMYLPSYDWKTLFSWSYLPPLAFQYFYPLFHKDPWAMGKIWTSDLGLITPIYFLWMLTTWEDLCIAKRRFFDMIFLTVLFENLIYFTYICLA